MTRASRRGVALASGGVAGLAIATLVLPQLANTLKPTALAIGLLTLVLGLLTLMAQRCGEFYRRRSDLESALLAYPPDLLGTADPSTLGVFAPVTGRSGTASEPQPLGSSHQRLDQALRDSSYVVVRGPIGCGKSRAAAEAASRVWQGVPVLVPFDAEGLRRLQDDEFDIKLIPRDRGVCVWLDGLNRFLGVLDTRALTPRRRNPAVRLARGLSRRGDYPARLVATIRDEQWASVRGGTDQRSEALRALERISTVVTLDEAGAVIDVQPESTGDETDEATTSPSAGGLPARTPRPKPPWRDALAFGLVMLTSLVAIVLAILYLWDVKELFQAPPISDQIASITAAMENDVGHGHVVFSDRAWLHSTEQPSWIIGVQHGPTHAARHAAKLGLAKSDELRIYDIHDGWLDRKLDFQPTVVGGQAAELQQVAANSSGNAGLYNNSGTAEFIAGYAVGGYSSPTILPFGIDWETVGTKSGYKLAGLTQYRDADQDTGPGFSTQHLRPPQAAFLKTNYGKSITLKNGSSGVAWNPALLGYPVSAFALTLQPSGRLLLGYLLEAYDFAHTNDLELEVGQIRSGGIAMLPCSRLSPTCSGPARPEEVHVPPDKGDSQALLEEWPDLKSHWAHRILVTNA
jgi:hypothetical protein